MPVEGPVDDVSSTTNMSAAIETEKTEEKASESTTKINDTAQSTLSSSTTSRASSSTSAHTVKKVAIQDKKPCDH